MITMHFSFCANIILYIQYQVDMYGMIRIRIVCLVISCMGQNISLDGSTEQNLHFFSCNLNIIKLNHRDRFVPLNQVILKRTRMFNVQEISSDISAISLWVFVYK